MNYKVSIIIPAYNVETYIHRSIESSIKQTYNNTEIIIVDDGSTDKTWNIICDYSKKYKKIIANKQNNSGVSDARNKGLSIATGDYAIFIDSDDWIDEKCVEHLINAMKQHETHILIASDCNYAYLREKTIDITSSKKNYKATNIYMNKEKSMISFCNSQYRLSSACYKLFNMELIKKYDLHFDETISYGEDGLFVYNYLKHCNGLYYFNEALWYILDRPGSATTTKYNKKWLSAVESAEMIIKDNNEEKLINYFKLYACNRIATVLCNAIKSDKKDNKSDIIFLKKKLKQYISCICCEKSFKRISLYLFLAYFPISVSRFILRVFN